MRADARRNYEALLAAARELFLEQGSEAPLDEVAKRAGVGAGTLYRHFPSRTDLLAAVYVSDFDELCDLSEQLSALGPGRALSEYMDLHLSFGMRNNGIKRAMRELLADVEPQPPVLTMCRTRIHDITGRLLQDAQEAGVARKDVDLPTFIRMIHGITLAAEDTPELASGMLQLMKDGLQLKADADAEPAAAEVEAAAAEPAGTEPAGAAHR
jgi:AcrR family transcriptional regulator